MNSYSEFFILWKKKEKRTRKRKRKKKKVLFISLSHEEKEILFISLSHWNEKILSIYFVVAWKKEKNLTNLQLIHSLQKNCESCKSCNSYTTKLRRKTSLCKNIKIAKSIVLSFTCHVITSRALLDASILTIIYKFHLSYIVKIQCVYHLFLTNWKIVWYLSLRLCDYNDISLLFRHVDFKA